MLDNAGLPASGAISAAATPPRRRRRRLVTLRIVRDGTFVPGVGGENAVRALRRPIRGGHDVYECMRPYAEREATEAFWILPLDRRDQVIGPGPIVISRGLIDATLVDPREVFSAALLVKAAAVVLCHNHPSGDPTPSCDDREMTATLVAAGEVLEVPVKDHVIVGWGCYMSFMEAGLL